MDCVEQPGIDTRESLGGGANLTIVEIAISSLPPMTQFTKEEMELMERVELEYTEWIDD